jgi:integrase
MSKKRGNGEGSIYKRKRDGRWVASLTLGWKENGTLERKEFVATTRAEVVAKMDAAKRAMAEGKPVKFEIQTVGQFLGRWLEDSKKHSVKPKTLDSYGWAINNHLIPGLGRHQLHKLGPQDVQAFLNQKANSGLKPKSVQELRSTLRAALNDAMKWDLVHRNVAALASPPRADRQPKRVWSVAEAQAFLAAVQGHKFEGVFRLALCFGVREGEILALRWADVDFGGQCFFINKTQQRLGGQIVSGSPKTESSNRRIPLALGLADLLVARKGQQDAQRIEAGPDWKETGLVFTTGRGTAIDMNNLRRDYTRIIDKAGLEYITFHSLRSTAASLLKEHGLTDEEIRILLGHSTAKTTRDFYLHQTPDSERRLVDGLNKVFSSVEFGGDPQASRGRPN